MMLLRSMNRLLKTMMPLRSLFVSIFWYACVASFDCFAVVPQFQPALLATCVRRLPINVFTQLKARSPVVWQSFMPAAVLMSMSQHFISSLVGSRIYSTLGKKKREHSPLKGQGEHTLHCHVLGAIVVKQRCGCSIERPNLLPRILSALSLILSLRPRLRSAV